MPQQVTESDLRQEIDELKSRFPKLGEDDLFLTWFLRAVVTDDEMSAVKALCGGSGDKSVDAIHIDDQARSVVILQGKYRRGIAQKLEDRADVVAFAQLAPALVGPAASFRELRESVPPEVGERLDQARERIQRRKYRLQLYYVTTGRTTDAQFEEGRRVAYGAECQTMFATIGGAQVLRILGDYLDGVAPPVPALALPLEGGDGVSVRSVLQRYDNRTGIESWVISITAQSVADVFREAGIRVFARNVRGFLGGSTKINQGMEDTLESEPEHFWYYNNGITIVCDHAKSLSEHGREVLHVENPQIINGQQTTRTLAKMFSRAPKAGVLVRVIRIPRDENDDVSRFEGLVSNIVAATNWQNAILQSDLRANDRKQIEIERQLRKLGYGYIRKRQTKGEAKRALGGHFRFLIRKDELAQAVAACDLDPKIVREGKENLFDEKWYSQVFPTSDPYFYLPKFQLQREVKYAATGRPERAYAKWLVLNAMWKRFQSVVRSKPGADAFRAAWERNRYPLRPLYLAIDVMYKAALHFYRLRRGRGEKAKDASTFFKLKGLDRDFAKFWDSASNRHRGAFRRLWKRFLAALAEDAAE